MSTSTYNALWQEAIRDLQRQVEEESLYAEVPADADANADASEAKPPDKREAVPIEEAFRHYSRLYVNYVRILSRLEACHDAMVQPQKRADVRDALERVACRVIDLRHNLARWNPPNPDVRVPPGGGEAQPPFPWEYVDLGPTLREMRVPPGEVEATVPRYFAEDQSRRQRDTLVEGYMKLKLGPESISLTEGYDDDDGGGDEGPEHAEDGGPDDGGPDDGGPAAPERDDGDSDDSEDGDSDSDSDSDSDGGMDGDAAAVELQRLSRGFLARAQARRERREEGALIGMVRPGGRRRADLESARDEARRRRGREQVENQEAYEAALYDLKEVVLEEEGFEIRERLRDERIGWATDRIAQTGEIPDSLEGFYKPPPNPQEEKEVDVVADAAKGKGKGKEKVKKPDDKKGKDKKSEGKGKKGDSAVSHEVEVPSLQPPLHIMERLKNAVKTYEGRWKSRADTLLALERHDPELAKDLIVRGQVEAELTKIVDETLLANLTKVKELHADKGKKGKKGGKGKKSKDKKGKKGAKGKKDKPLPGEKLSAIKGMDSAHMLSILIEHKIVNNPAKVQIQDLMGSFLAANPSRQNKDKKPTEGPCVPSNPSMQQLRSAITEYCILPNGSSVLSL